MMTREAIYGPSEFDARHRIVVSGFYQFPFKANRLISGWQLGLVTMAQSSNPITPLLVIGPAPGSSLTVRPDQLQRVTSTNNPNQFYSNTVLCEPFNGDTHRRCACHPGLCSDTKRGLRCSVHVQRHTEYPGR